MCVHVCVCVHKYKCTPVCRYIAHECGCQRTALAAVCQALPTWFLSQVFSLTWNWLSRLNPKDIPTSTSASLLGVKSKAPSPAFSREFWGLKTDPQDCSLSSLHLKYFLMRADYGFQKQDVLIEAAWIYVHRDVSSLWWGSWSTNSFCFTSGTFHD